MAINTFYVKCQQSLCGDMSTNKLFKREAQETKAGRGKQDSNIQSNLCSWKVKFADAYASQEGAPPIISEHWIVWRP